MKTVTNEFKEQITKLGREIDFKFFLHTNDKIITEDSNFLMTQDNRHLVVEQFDDEEVDETITGEDIYNVSIVNQGKLLSTLMKEVDFEVKEDLRIGDVVSCQFGLKVGTEYEYIDYGKYMVYSKEFNEDTKSYSYVAFDRMLLTMKEASKDFLTSLEGQTLAFTIHKICEEVGLSYTATQEELTEYPNLNKQINEGTFTDMQITYRDILDIICQALGLSMITDGSNLKLKTPIEAEVEIFSKNLFNKENIERNKYYQSNSIGTSQNWSISQVPVEPNTNYYLSGNNVSNTTARIVLLDSLKNIIQDLGGYKDVHSITTNSNTAYIGLSIAMYSTDSDIDDIQLEKGTSQTEYEPYYHQTVSGDIDEKYIKDTNVSFGEKYMINSVVLSRSEDTDNIYRRDEESIAENGLHEFKIKDNLIMLYDDREDYIDEIFEQLNGLEYYINDYSSTGITYLDWLDFYNVNIGDKTYKCLMLNDEININQGLEENIYAEEPEETVTPYKTSSKTDKEVSFIVDKQNGSIRAKVNKGDIINEINLDESGVNIKGNKISLEGTVTANNNFKIKTDGTMECKGAKINIEDNGYTGNNFFSIANYYTGTNYPKEEARIYSDYFMISSFSLNPWRTVNEVYANADETIAEVRCESLSNGLQTYQAYIATSETDGMIKIFKVNTNNEITQYISNSSTYIRISDGDNSTVLQPTSIYTTNLYVSGSKNRVVEIEDGKKVCLGAYETATPYFGDIGSNKTNENGYCKIEIDNIFKQTIENDDYKVFIQECGDGRLYVEKYETYFIVKGTPNLDFDWELKAIQKGYKNTRLQEPKVFNQLKESDK